MTWTCEQIEERLNEYTDRLLGPEELRRFSSHLEQCVRCARLVAQVNGLVARLHQMEPLEAPPRLVYAILERTAGPRREKRGWLAWLGPFAQPRFAMGAVTVLLTMAILIQALGDQPRKANLAAFNPVNWYRAADRRATLLYARGVKFVNDLRVVYEIQSRLQPEDEREPSAPAQRSPGQSQEQRPGRETNHAVDLKSLPPLVAASLPGLRGRSN